MDKTIRILIGLLIAQLVIAAVVLWPRPAATGSNEPLFPGLTVDAIVSVKVSDDTGHNVQVAKRGNEWVLPDADDYPAQADRVTALLNKIVALKTSRLVTQTVASHKRLRVAADDFARRVDLTTADGETSTLFIGTAPQAQATHVRAEGQDQVYLTDELTAFDAGAQPSAYVNTAYVSVPAADVTGLTLQNAQGQLVLQKDANGAWTLADLALTEQVDSAAVDNLVRRATSMTLLRPLGKQAKPEYGLDAPVAVVTLAVRSGDGQSQTITLRVGAQDPADNSYVVSSSQSPYLVRVAEFGVQDLVTKGRADVLAQPTPTPTVEATPAAS